jgi:hypothetical protein
MQRLTGLRDSEDRGCCIPKVFVTVFFLLCAPLQCDWYIHILCLKRRNQTGKRCRAVKIAPFPSFAGSSACTSIAFVCEYCKQSELLLRHPTASRANFINALLRSPADSGRQCARHPRLCLRTHVVSANHCQSDGSGRGPHYGGS